jgi:Zn-dependent M28 family amino/carboxypeptidase
MLAAVDNASGVSMMLALARALAQHRGTLKRSFLFVSLTGEEAGLIGAQVPTTRVCACVCAAVARACVRVRA